MILCVYLNVLLTRWHHQMESSWVVWPDIMECLVDMLSPESCYSQRIALVCTTTHLHQTRQVTSSLITASVWKRSRRVCGFIWKDCSRRRSVARWLRRLSLRLWESGVKGSYLSYLRIWQLFIGMTIGCFLHDTSTCVDLGVYFWWQLISQLSVCTSDDS